MFYFLTYFSVGGGGLPPPPASFMPPGGGGGEGGPPGRPVMSETNGNGDQVDATGYNLAFGGLTHRRPPSPGECNVYGSVNGTLFVLFSSLCRNRIIPVKIQWLTARGNKACGYLNVNVLFAQK